MLKIVSAVVATALAFASVLPAQAAESTVWKYGNVGGWDIMVDPSTGNGCFAYMVYERGSIMRLGIDKANGRVYMLFGKNGWASMEAGKVYNIEFLFDDYSRYTGNVTVKDMSGYSFLSHNSLSKDFINDFARRNNLKIFWNGRTLLNVSLQNTTVAMDEIVRCQQQVDGSQTPTSRRGPASPGEML